MKVLLLGAGGMVGRKLAERIAADEAIGGNAVETLRLVDIVAPTVPSGSSLPVRADVLDMSQPGAADKLIAEKPDLIFHLAAIVSGEAEADFEKGYRINLDSTRATFEAIRALHESENYTPRLVFASSLAVFGAPLPPSIGDDFHLTPLTSYGTQKAICELLLCDYTRRGILDGYGLRLPTICVRPGKPNKAASGFFSNILREPINGQEAVLPVSETVRHWFASPRAAVEFFMHAAQIDGKRVGPRRALNMPGLSATVGEEIEALARFVGPKAVGLIRREPDAAIEKIVASWPQGFEAKRAHELSFVAEASFDEIIRVYVEDEIERAAA